MLNLKAVILIFAASSLLLADQPEVIPLSDNVGTTLDAEENAILGVFPDIDGFENAQFFQHSINRYSARIVYRERNRQKNIKRKYNFSQFNQLQNKVKNHPEITEEMRAKFHYELSYLRVDDILKSIPPNSFTTVKRYEGLPVTGRYVEFADRKLRLKQVVGEKVIPVTNIEDITYRPIAKEGNTVDKQGNATKVEAKGRHDPCVGIRATPIAEAMVSIILMDHYLRNRAQNADVVLSTPVIPSKS